MESLGGLTGDKLSDTRNLECSLLYRLCNCAEVFASYLLKSGFYNAGT